MLLGIVIAKTIYSVRACTVPYVYIHENCHIEQWDICMYIRKAINKYWVENVDGIFSHTTDLCCVPIKIVQIIIFVFFFAPFPMPLSSLCQTHKSKMSTRNCSLQQLGGNLPWNTLNIITCIFHICEQHLLSTTLQMWVHRRLYRTVMST